MVRDGARAPPHHEASIRKQAMDDLKSIIGKVATGATLSRDEGRFRLRQHDVRRGHALADGRIADGIACPRRNRR